MTHGLAPAAVPVFRALALFAAFSAGCDGQSGGGRKLSELKFEKMLESRTVTVTGRVVRATSPETLPAATPDAAVEFYRSYGDSRQTSRVGRALPTGDWQLSWSAEVNPAFPPDFLMEARDRILMQSGEWRLYDRAGKELSSGRATGAPLFTDSANGLFYSINPDAYLVAQKLAAGEHEFRILPAHGDGYTRVHLARKGSLMTDAGVERELDPHGEHPATRSLVEVFDVGTTPKSDDLGFLSTSSLVGTLMIPVPRLVAASSPDLIVAATTDWVYILKWDLQVEAGLQGSFHPHAVSLDEAGRIYLVAESGGRESLWLLKSGGERLYAFDLPPQSGTPSTPAIIGYDHTAYVLTDSRIFAVGGDGKQRWSKSAAGIAGAVVTADGRLLVVESGAVASYDGGGERTELVKVAGLVTPPLLTREGQLLVASKTTVYCYSVK